MKKLILFILILSNLTIYSLDLPIMVEFRNKTIPSDFLDGVEEELLTMNFLLIDKKIQELALKEQAKQRKSDCYDDECLVDTGKMLAAKAVILIDAEPINYYSIKFTARYIDLETGSTTQKTTKYFDYSLKENRKLLKFGKNLVKYLFNKKVEKENYIFYKKKKTEKSRWTFSLGGNFGLSIKSLKIDNNSYKGAGVSLSGNIDLAYDVARFKEEMTVALYSELSYWSIGGAYDYNSGENKNLRVGNILLNLNLGVEFILGRKLMELPLFIRIGIGNGYLSYKSSSIDTINKYAFKTLGLNFEIGIDQKLFNNLFDFYIGTNLNLYLYEIDNSSIKVSGVELPIYMGFRHSF